MRTETQRKADARLAKIEGQIRAVRKMVTEDRYCIDVVRQVQAAVLHSAVLRASSSTTMLILVSTRAPGRQNRRTQRKSE